MMAKPDFHLEMIDRACGGTSTVRIMRHFCEAVEAGEQPDPRVMNYLAEAFREIEAGLNDLRENEAEGKKDPKRSRTIAAFTMKALNLNDNRGRKNSMASKKAQGYGKIVRDMVHEMDDNKLTYSDAVAKVAEARHKSKETVKKAYSEFGNAWRSMRNSVKDCPDDIK